MTTTVPSHCPPPAEPLPTEPRPSRSALQAAYQVLARQVHEDRDLLAWARQHLVGDNHWLGDGPLSVTDREYLRTERRKLEGK